MLPSPRLLATSSSSLRGRPLLQQLPRGHARPAAAFVAAATAPFSSLLLRLPHAGRGEAQALPPLPLSHLLPVHRGAKTSTTPTSTGKGGKGSRSGKGAGAAAASKTKAAASKSSGSSSSHPMFFKVEGASVPEADAAAEGEYGGFVVGEVTDHAIDLHDIRPGEVIDIPYELTISSAFRDFWQSVFYSHDRLVTSTPFARKLGFQDQVLPYSLVCFLAASMSHADLAIVQVGFQNAIYHWPAFAGDTITKRFILRSVRAASNNKYSIFNFLCELKNQRGQVIFTCEKSMLFPVVLPPSHVAFPTHVPPRHLEDHLIARADSLHALGSQSLQSLRPGQLLLHSLARPISTSQSMQLSSLARLTHERHFNTRKFKRDEIFIPGGLVLGLTLAASARDLHEVLHEELLDCSFINSLNPQDIVTSVSYVKELQEDVTADLECLLIRTIGLKNLELRELVGRPFPLELFTRPGLRTKQVEAICRAHMPELSKKVVAVVDRRVLRQSPKTEAFLL